MEEARARFVESARIVIKALTTNEVFDWEGGVLQDSDDVHPAPTGLAPNRRAGETAQRAD